MAMRCHSVFEDHSSSAFFQAHCVARESTVNFKPLPFLIAIAQNPHADGRWFSKRVIALWLASKLLTTKDAVRLALDGLGTVGSVLG